MIKERRQERGVVRVVLLPAFCHCTLQGYGTDSTRSRTALNAAKIRCRVPVPGTIPVPGTAYAATWHIISLQYTQ